MLIQPDPSPSAPVRTSVADLQSGQQVTGYYVCSDKITATDKNGKAFLRLKLRDASGEVAAIHFDPSDEALAMVAGEVVTITGAYSLHPQYGPQIQVRRLSVLGQGEYDPADLVPVSPIDAVELGEWLASLVESVEDAHLRALLDRAFDASREPGATFAVAPAAVRNHHAYRYGLIEHSLFVADTAADVASRFDSVDRDLVVTGGLLHDIGKTRAYTSDGLAPLMTDSGRLQGEIVVGHDTVRGLIAEFPDFPADLALRLLHIIVSHHGLREKGSPIVPMTREAIIVHYCDDMTARLAAVDDAERATTAGQAWSNRIMMIDAPAYFGRAPGDD